MIALSILLSIVVGQVQPTFPPPPRLATTADQLAGQKSAGNFEQTRSSAAAEGDAILKEGMVVPDGSGDWIFYYANPENGHTLEAISPTEHRDPATGKIFTDKRTIAAYRTKLHYKVEREAERVAWSYAYTGDDKYADAVRKVLLKLADDYPTYPKRLDRWGRTGWFAPLGGRRYAQSLDEAVGVIKLCRAYDLTRTAPVWSDQERAHVEKDFFRATADCLLWFNQGINNHQTWYNAGLMHIANVLADAKLVDKILTMKGGFYFQLQYSVDEDGNWYEGTVAYHYYALSAMRDIVAAARPLGLKLDEAERYKALFTGPPKMAYPNGQFPAINDSDRTYLLNYRGYNPDNLEPPTTSMNLKGSGLAILRRGEGDNAVCAMIDYGPHGEGHGHFDKLELLLYASGREWLLDPGRLSYSNEAYKTWVKHTAAHNTVALDGKDQLPTTGQCLWFTTEKEYDACALACDTAYPGTTLRRYLILQEKLLIDVFEVESTREHQIDWFTHAIADNIEHAKIESESVSLGDDDGYPHLNPALRMTPQPNLRWTFTAGDKKLATWLMDTENPTVFTTHGIGYTLNEKTPTILRRRNAKTATFHTAYDLTADGSYITAAEPGRITTTDGVITYTLNPTGATVGHTPAP